MSSADQKELNIIVDKINEVVSAEVIYLFGSFAEETQQIDSDFDLDIVLDDTEERPIRAIQKMYTALAPLNIRAIDILANYREAFEKATKNMSLEKTILEKGIKLYG